MSGELRVPTPDDEWNRPYACGHWTRTPGCGGCDPGAIELQVLDDGTVLRDGDPGWQDAYTPRYAQPVENPVDERWTAGGQP